MVPLTLSDAKGPLPPATANHAWIIPLLWALLIAKASAWVFHALAIVATPPAVAIMRLPFPRSLLLGLPGMGSHHAVVSEHQSLIAIGNLTKRGGSISVCIGAPQSRQKGCLKV